MPEDFARRLTERFFEERLRAVPNIASLVESLSKKAMGPTLVLGGKEAKELRDVVKAAGGRAKEEEKEGEE